MNLSSVAHYFNRTPIYGWNGTKWVDLKNLGSASNFLGDENAASADRGERRLLTDKPIPTTTFVVRLGSGKVDPYYIIGYRDEHIGSTRHEEPFSYIVHSAHELMKIYRATKAMTAAGTPKNVTWAEIQQIHGNALYVNSAENKLLDATVFPAYSVNLPGNCVATTEDEIRTTKYTYVIKNIYTLNELVVAVCTRKNAVPVVTP